jgi:hypothetical protein
VNLHCSTKLKKKPVLSGYQARVDNLSVNVAGFDTRRMSWEENKGEEK